MGHNPAGENRNRRLCAPVLKDRLLHKMTETLAHRFDTSPPAGSLPMLLAKAALAVAAVMLLWAISFSPSEGKGVKDRRLKCASIDGVLMFDEFCVFPPKLSPPHAATH